MCLHTEWVSISPFSGENKQFFHYCLAITISLALSYYAAVNHMLQDKQENTVHKVNFSPGSYSTVFILFLLRKKTLLFFPLLFLILDFFINAYCRKKKHYLELHYVNRCALVCSRLIAWEYT